MSGLFLYLLSNLKTYFNMKNVLFLAAGLFASTAMVAQSYEASLGLGALSAGSLKLEGMYHF